MSLKTEPVLIGIAASDLILGAGLLMSNALGWTDLDVGALAAISGFVVAVSGTAAGIIRSAVTPTSRVGALPPYLPPVTPNFPNEFP